MSRCKYGADPHELAMPPFRGHGLCGVERFSGLASGASPSRKVPRLFSVNNVERFGSPRVDLRRYP